MRGFSLSRVRRYVWGPRIAWLGMAIFVGTVLVVAHRAGWPEGELPLPAWSVPLVIGGWVLVIVGSLMARGGADM
jgi:hypothetical protein